MNSNFLFERAAGFVSTHNTSLAMDLLRQLLHDDPNHAPAHWLLGAILLDEKRLVAAEHELKLSLELDPTAPDAHLSLGRLFFLKRNSKTALACIAEAQRLDPENEEALILHGVILESLFKMDEALASYNAALAIEPTSIDALVARGDLFFARKQISEALDDVTVALKGDPEDAKANVLMSQVQLYLGNVDEARYHAMFAISLDPTDASALNAIGNVKARESWFLGLWWRANARVTSTAPLKQSMILVGAFIFFRVLAQLLSDLEYPLASSIVSNGWLLIVLYSWVGLPLYQRMLRTEIETFMFSDDF
ncbi:MAG: tetratricopeptide repeat protein [Deltaproteobacteria bacterium]|nr:tetratricopeptide repeat protein [Deltaproteobacteria bacterium]